VRVCVLVGAVGLAVGLAGGSFGQGTGGEGGPETVVVPAPSGGNSHYVYVTDPVTMRLLVYEHHLGRELELLFVRNLEHEVQLQTFTTRRGHQSPPVGEMRDMVRRARGGAPRAVRIATGDGVLLGGELRLARRKEEAPVAVLLHGLEGDRSVWEVTAARLEGAGFSVLALDLRGHGESTVRAGGGALRVEEVPAAERGGLMADAAAEDVPAAVGHLVAEHGLPAEKVFLLGVGEGAEVALEAALDHLDVLPVGVGLVGPVPGGGDGEVARRVAAYGGHVATCVGAEAEAGWAMDAPAPRPGARLAPMRAVFRGDGESLLEATGLELTRTLRAWAELEGRLGP